MKIINDIEGAPIGPLTLSCVLNKKEEEERECRTCYAAEEDSQPVQGITRLQDYSHTYLSVKRISFTDELLSFNLQGELGLLYKGDC